MKYSFLLKVFAFFKHHSPQTATRKLPKLFTPSLWMPWWLIYGKTERSNSTACSSKRTEENTYKSRGVVIPHSFGISKSWRKRKQIHQANLPVKKYLNAKIFRSAYIFKGITDFWETIPCSLYGHQSLGTECDRHDHKWQKPTEVQRSLVSTLPLFKKAKEKHTRGTGSKTKLYPYEEYISGVWINKFIILLSK